MSRTWTLLPFAGVLLLGSFAGCGDDTEPSGPTTTSTSTSTSTNVGGAGAEGGGGSGTQGGSGGIGGAGAQGGGGSGAQGGGGSGGGGVPSNDSCTSPEVVPLTLGDKIAIQGTLVEATDDYSQQSCCDTPDKGDGEPDVVYQLELSDLGSLKLTLDDGGAQGFDGGIAIRKTSCDMRVGVDECVNLSSNGEVYGKELAAGTYWVLIDSCNGDSASFTLQAELSAPTCGDGVVNPSIGEQCDGSPNCQGPGDPQPCKFNTPPQTELESCTTVMNAMDVSISKADGELAIGEYTTVGATDDAAGSCLGPNLGGVDHVLRFVPTENGNLTITVGNHPQNNFAQDWCTVCGNDMCQNGDGCWVKALYARSGACEGPQATEVACAYDNLQQYPLTATITFPVQASTPYWVFVDSYAPEAVTYASGPYWVQAKLE